MVGLLLLGIVSGTLSISNADFFRLPVWLSQLPAILGLWISSSAVSVRENHQNLCKWQRFQYSPLLSASSGTVMPGTQLPALRVTVVVGSVFVSFFTDWLSEASDFRQVKQLPMIPLRFKYYSRCQCCSWLILNIPFTNLSARNRFFFLFGYVRFQFVDLLAKLVYIIVVTIGSRLLGIITNL